MHPFRTILVASAILALAAPAVASATKSGAIPARSGEMSAAQRQDVHRRKVQRRPAQVVVVQPTFRRFADPSIAPNGRPYPVPENLRNQCYIDEGYGRFSACSFRN